MKTPILAFLLVLAASSAFAQTFAPELAPAAAKYKADMATLEAQRLAALAQAQKSHAAALDAAEKTATAAGSLPVVAAITKERESLIADTLTSSFPDGLPKNLQTTRKAYLDAAANIRVNEATRRAAIGAEYLRAFASLQSKAVANPELAQQIAAEKGKLLTTAAPSVTKSPATAATHGAATSPKYVFVEEKLAYPDAVKKAAAAGGFIAMGKTEKERAALREIAMKNKVDRIWLGASRPDGSLEPWTWADGKPIAAATVKLIQYNGDVWRNRLRLQNHNMVGDNIGSSFSFVIELPK